MARRNRNRRGNSAPTPQLSCTCSLQWETSPPGAIDHDGHCMLWHSEDFMNGLADWDPIGQKLFTLPAWDDFDEDAVWDGDVPMGGNTSLQDIIDATVEGHKGTVPAYKGAQWGYFSCRHNMTVVNLPDEAGTVVHCSGSSDCRGRFNRPEWAVYLCNSWTPASLAMFVPWTDYGTPTIPWRAVRWAVEDFYARAQKGMVVEVGCMGGHGRTGTFLACLAMLADPNMSPKGAVAWVRKNYCDKAIESRSQEYFLEWFADPSLPPVPPAPPVKVTVAKPTVPGGGCNWSRNNQPCLKELGHKGGHYYGGKKGNGPGGKPAAEAVRPGMPIGELSPGRKVICPTCSGQGGVECGTCRNWRVVDAPASDSPAAEVSA